MAIDIGIAVSSAASAETTLWKMWSTPLSIRSKTSAIQLYAVQDGIGAGTDTMVRCLDERISKDECDKEDAEIIQP